jgi:hypothetical protein
VRVSLCVCAREFVRVCVCVCVCVCGHQLTYFIADRLTKMNTF